MEYSDCVHLLIYAHNLCIIYNIKNLSKEIAETTFSIINYTIDTEDARWIIEPIKILLKLDNILNHLVAIDLITRLQNEALKFHSRTDILCALLAICRDLSKHLNLDNSEKQELQRTIQLKIAKTWEESADRNMVEGDAIHAILDYEKAVEEYKRMGDSKKEKELGQKIRSACEKYLGI
jgi:hypothetical protein